MDVEFLLTERCSEPPARIRNSVCTDSALSVFSCQRKQDVALAHTPQRSVSLTGKTTSLSACYVDGATRSGFSFDALTTEDIFKDKKNNNTSLSAHLRGNCRADKVARGRRSLWQAAAPRLCWRYAPPLRFLPPSLFALSACVHRY